MAADPNSNSTSGSVVRASASNFDGKCWGSVEFFGGKSGQTKFELRKSPTTIGCGSNDDIEVPRWPPNAVSLICDLSKKEYSVTNNSSIEGLVKWRNADVVSTDSINLPASQTTPLWHRDAIQLKGTVVSLKFYDSRMQFVQNSSGDRIVDIYHTPLPLGSGGFGQVFKVSKNSNFYAKKVVDKYKWIDKMEGTGSKLKITSEIDLLKQANHPNIVKFYDYYIGRPTFEVVMEFCDGGDMFDYLVTNGKYSAEHAQLVFHQIVSAVDFLHDNKIVHRDLKPSNIFIMDANSNVVKVGDLGVANQSETDAFNTKIGTTQYMAPEMKNPPYDKKVDIWAIGIILYVMLTGFEPPQGNKPAGKAKTTGDIGAHDGYNLFFGADSNVTKAAQDLTFNCANTDPKQRFTAKQVMDCEWMQEMKDKLKLVQKEKNSSTKESTTKTKDDEEEEEQEEDIDVKDFEKDTQDDDEDTGKEPPKKKFRKE